MKRILLVLVLIVSISACDPPVKPWAARVNGRVIPAETLNDELKEVVSNPKLAAAEASSLQSYIPSAVLQPSGKNTVDTDYTAQVLSGRIIDLLVKQELARLGLMITDDARKRAETLARGQYPDPTTFDSLSGDYRNYLLDRYAATFLLLDIESTPEKQRDYYNAHMSEFLSSVCLRHIMVPTQDQALAIRTRLVNGEDFAAIAKSESVDSDPATGTADKGGELGCFSNQQVSQFPDVFRTAAQTLPVGQLSEPLESNSGVHIVQITSRQMLTFEQAQPQVVQLLANPASLINHLLEDAKVDVNPRYAIYTPGNRVTGEEATIKPYVPSIPTDDNSEGQGNMITNPFMG